jgi:hypothetical protein
MIHSVSRRPRTTLTKAANAARSASRRLLRKVRHLTDVRCVMSAVTDRTALFADDEREAAGA